MMPGTFRYSSSQDEPKSPPLPPPVAPRVTVQSWRESTTSVAPPDVFGHHIRSGSVDSLDSSSGSSVSSSSSGGNHSRQLSGDSCECIPTRTVIKSPSASVHNPLQFIKVQSPLYKKAEQQIKLSKEVKITREKVKEGEEEWQSNLDNWKSRRRKVSEKVFQRAEEMRQVEAEELLRQQQQQQQQKKIKTFSEIVENRSQKKCSYNLDLYVGQGDDSGLGATPEPEDQDSLENQISCMKSDASEDASESESVDSDVRTSEKASGKEPPKVPKKPHSWLSRSDQSMDVFSMNKSAAVNELMQECLKNELSSLDNPSSSEPSDVEGHAADAEAVFSEDDAMDCAATGNVDSGLESLCDSQRAGDIADSESDFSQDSCGGSGDNTNHEFYPELVSSHRFSNAYDKKEARNDTSFVLKHDSQKLSFKILVKHGAESKGFGFSLKGGKDQGSAAFVDSVTSGGPADIAGLSVEDKILSINGEETSSSSHASLIFAIKQAVYIGQLELVVWRPAAKQDMSNGNARSSKKGSSFAEKIAMFSCGSSSPSSSTSTISSSLVQLRKDTDAEDLKKESLVLRRRSTFENSCAIGSQNKSRWSANLCNEATAGKLHHYERQHSADFTSSISKFSSINAASKKAPPPPIPLKPKLKVKDCIPSLTTSSASKDRQMFDVQSVNTKPVVKDSSDETGQADYVPDLSLVEQKVVFVSEPSSGKPVCEEVQNASNCYHCVPDVLDSRKEANSQEYFSQKNIIDGSDENVVHTKFNSSEIFSPSSEVNMHSVHNSVSYGNSMKTMKIPPTDTVEISPIILQNVPELTLISNTPSSVTTNGSITLLSKSDTEDSCVIPESTKDFAAFSEENVCVPIVGPLDLNEIYDSSDLCVNNKIEEHEIQLGSPLSEENEISSDDKYVAEEFGSKTEQWETQTAITENSEIAESETGLREKGLLVEINMQTLGLALEKIEEDDVVSASTTASSETPDTETVIEHFPTNISPLPNDDIVNESLNLDGADGELNMHQNPEVNLNDNITDADAAFNMSIPCVHELPSSKDLEGIQVCDSTEMQHEIFNPSTNSAVLDVSDIDEIERRLMLQLEQEEIMLEDINAGNNELKDEVERQLLYLSDDCYLLDDLDAPPRHISPPSEPPPPPPENDCEENKTPPLMRVNSTKRIKKEIWRRRSDFLGLDSPEAISIDDIPPPPPGLEELFKSEMEMGREQKLWLEKRLSLAEPLPSDVTSSDTQSMNTFNCDGAFSLEHVLKVLDAEVYDAVPCDKSQSKIEGASESHLAEELVSEPLEGSIKNEILDNFQSNNVVSQSATESLQHRVKHHIQSLGAAPRAKIMDSNTWITQTEKVSPKKQKSMDPLFRDSSYNHNFWISQEANHHRSPESTTPRSHIPADRRFSMPPTCNSGQPDVTVRTWDDRELESYPQQRRPRSCLWQTQCSSVPDTYNPSGLIGESKTFAESQSSSQSNTLMGTVSSVPRCCSFCGYELTNGSAMGIDALELYFHIECFRCCVCQIQLGNGSCGTDVQVKSNELYCQNCFRID